MCLGPLEAVNMQKETLDDNCARTEDEEDYTYGNIRERQSNNHHRVHYGGVSSFPVHTQWPTGVLLFTKTQL